MHNYRVPVLFCWPYHRHLSLCSVCAGCISQKCRVRQFDKLHAELRWVGTGLSGCIISRLCGKPLLCVGLTEICCHWNVFTFEGGQVRVPLMTQSATHHPYHSLSYHRCSSVSIVTRLDICVILEGSRRGRSSEGWKKQERNAATQIDTHHNSYVVDPWGCLTLWMWASVREMCLKTHCSFQNRRETGSPVWLVGEAVSLLGVFIGFK
jgi:hypothetical protein